MGKCVAKRSAVFIPFNSPGKTHFMGEETGSHQADALARSLRPGCALRPISALFPGSWGPETASLRSCPFLPLIPSPVYRAVASSRLSQALSPPSSSFLLEYPVPRGRATLPPCHGPRSSQVPALPVLKGSRKACSAAAPVPRRAGLCTCSYTPSHLSLCDQFSLWFSGKCREQK